MRVEKLYTPCGGVKALAILLIFIISMCLVACGQNENKLICVSSEQLEVKYIMTCKHQDFGFSGEPVAIDERTKTATIFNVECDISSCSCYDANFTISYYQKGQDDIKQDVEDYQISYKGDKLKFIARTYREATATEKAVHWNSNTNLYEKQFFVFFTDSVVVEINCLQCKNINFTYTLN